MELDNILSSKMYRSGDGCRRFWEGGVVFGEQASLKVRSCVAIDPLSFVEQIFRISKGCCGVFGNRAEDLCAHLFARSLTNPA